MVLCSKYRPASAPNRQIGHDNIDRKFSQGAPPPGPPRKAPPARRPACFEGSFSARANKHHEKRTPPERRGSVSRSFWARAVHVWNDPS
eukprot:15448857-Alexandrium_andersonii.AAC.1